MKRSELSVGSAPVDHQTEAVLDRAQADAMRDYIRRQQVWLWQQSEVIKRIEALAKEWATTGGMLRWDRAAEALAAALAGPESDAQPEPVPQEPSEPEDGCGACWECVPDYPLMRVCATCGNKRCPHATDHRHACTGSNEPGQAGSIYGSDVPRHGDAP